MFSLITILCEAKACTSRSEARRLVAGRTVLVNGQVMDDITADLPEGALVEVGKRIRFTVPKKIQGNRA